MSTIAVTDGQFRDTTHELAGRVAGEDGTVHVVATVEALLHRSTH